VDHGGGVIESLPEGPGGHGLGQIAVGGGQDADIHRDGLGTAHAFELAFLEHAQELDLQLGRKLADLVEKNRALVGHLEPTAFPGHGPGKRPLFMAEKFRFEHARSERHAVDRDEGGVFARRGVVDGLGHELLAGTGFTGDEHRGAGGRGPGHHLQHPLHGLAPAHDVFRGEAVLERLAQHHVFALGRGEPGGLLHGEQQFVVGEGFGDVVEGAQAHGFHRALDAAEGGHDDDRDVGIIAFGVFEDLLPGHARHLHVRDDHVHFRLFQKGQAGLRVVQGGDGIAGIGQHGFQDKQIILFVVEDEDLTRHGSVVLRSRDSKGWRLWPPEAFLYAVPPPMPRERSW